LANVNMCDMFEITTQNSIPIDLVLNSSMSSTPLLLTTMNTLFLFSLENTTFISHQVAQKPIGDLSHQVSSKILMNSTNLVKKQS
jgi:hypothetical protein